MSKESEVREMFDVIADRLGEHTQARNYEIADSGEYETKLSGPVDVEALAEWLMPEILGLITRRQSITDEWEYGIAADGDDHEPYTDHYSSIEDMSDEFDGSLAREDEHLVRRRKAGPWEPVEAARDAS
jgi:hypothetical protein